MKNNLVWRLMRRNISLGQIVGYALANFVGLSIVLIALQFFFDSRAGSVEGEESFITGDYIVASKKVSEIGSLLGSANSFSEEELDELRSQPWVKDLGVFTPSLFQVSGVVDMAGHRMSTYLFFESIPDEFFDVKPRNWDFNPSDPDPVIPIIISKDYLALYNFGFAASRGMPQISEELISKIPLRVSVSGNGRQHYFNARVVGFSSRLNTIAVPDKFMQWANKTYGDNFSDHEISRVIISTDDPGNPAIEKYFTEHNIDVPQDKLNQGRAAYFMSIVAMIVVIVGIAICALSFFILMLSIFLLLMKNREKVRELLMLGYTPGHVARRYYLLVGVLNGAILIASLIVMLVASQLWKPLLDSLGMATASPWAASLIGAGLMVAVTVINILAIKRIVRRNF